MILYWDIETRSAVNLRDCGAYVYAIDPTTEPLCLFYAIDDADPQLWLPTDPVPPVFAEIAADPSPWQMVAHNYDFERGILENVLVPRYAFPLILHNVQHCTQRLALANAYPAELDLLAQALGLPYRKDPAARKAMLAVSRPRANRTRKVNTIPLWDEDPAKLQLTYERCRLDVNTTRAVWKSSNLKQLSGTERRYQLQDLAINHRGIRLDRAFATTARDLAIQERTAIGLKLQELTHGTITSADQVKRFLEAINARGHDMTSLNMRAVAQAIVGQPDDFVAQLLELRRTAARASVHKFKRMLCYASPADDRMRGTLRMYGGAPGRWSGLGPQLQNLKKNESGLPLSVLDHVREGNRAGIAAYGNPLALLGDISRAALCAAPGHELKSGDFSAIESVVLAWLAGEQWNSTLTRHSSVRATRSSSPTRLSRAGCCISRRPPRSRPPNGSLENAASLHPASAVRLELGAASFLMIPARITRSRWSSSSGAKRIRRRPNSGKISRVQFASPSRPANRSWLRRRRDPRSSPRLPTAT